MVHTYSLEHHVDAIWKSRALPKVRAFAWKMMSNSVAVRERLVRLGVQVPLGCPICGNPETILHMISVCMWVQGIWEALLGLSGAVLGGLRSRNGSPTGSLNPSHLNPREEPINQMVHHDHGVLVNLEDEVLAGF